MKSTSQQKWISWIHLATTGAALAFATVLVLAVITQSAQAQTFTTLHDFDATDGGVPVAPLVQGSDGNFYGTTPAGGANNNCPTSCGTVFKITPRGTLTTLYNFCSQTNCRMATNLSRLWSNPPMGPSTVQPRQAEPTIPPSALARCSKSLPAAL